METGKQDNSIREQVNKLDHVPEAFQFRAALVWQQIETRLTEKKRRQIGWLYGAAAAILVLMGGLWLTERRVGPPTAVKPSLVPTQTGTITGRDTLQNAKTPVQHSHPTNYKTTRRVAREEMAVQVNTTINSPAAEPDSSNQIAIAPPVVESLAITKAITKPRFRIAHMNELDNNNSASEIAQQPVKKRTLITSFGFSPKSATEDLVIKENTLYVETKPRGIFKSVQITKD